VRAGRAQPSCAVAARRRRAPPGPPPPRPSRYGYRHAQVVGRSYADLRATGGADVGEADDLTGTWRHRTAGGDELVVEVVAHRVIVRDHPAVLVLERDVTQEHRAREALERSEAVARATTERLQALIEAAPLGIVELDADWRPLSWNPTAGTLLGWGEGDARDLPTPRGSTWSDLRARLEQGRTVELAAVCEPDQRMLSLTLAPVRDASGAFGGSLLLAEDTTERQRLSQQLQQAQKLEAMGRLAGGIAHDFNNLLTGIIGFNDLAMAGMPAADPRREQLEQVRAAGERARRLVAQLLTFSRGQAQHREPVDLVGLVRAAEGLVAGVVSPGVAVDLDLPAEPVVVEADPSQLEQVLLNLAVNARDAMPDGGRLRVRVAARTEQAATPDGAITGPFAVLEVVDAGTGMPPEVANRVFEPFFTTKAPGRGTGLGLSTVYGIVRDAGGTILVDSAPGEGTTFRVLLPLSDRAPERDPATASVVTTGGSETLLVIDDHEAVRSLVEQLLAEIGYEVLTAGSGREATQRLRRRTQPVDLVLTDVALAGEDGRDVAEVVRAHSPDARVILMTGSADPSPDVMRPLDPSTGVLAKPFTRVDLVTAVRAALERASAGAVAGCRRCCAGYSSRWPWPLPSSAMRDRSSSGSSGGVPVPAPSRMPSSSSATACRAVQRGDHPSSRRIRAVSSRGAPSARLTQPGSTGCRRSRQVAAAAGRSSRLGTRTVRAPSRSATSAASSTGSAATLNAPRAWPATPALTARR
jgi:two-component system, cell cycle sensor histidine kinase and response regulator CckA